MALKSSNGMMIGKPPFRKLRGYAFDPVTSLDLDTAEINSIVYKIPWEDNLKPGPEGEYVKIIDRDPASDAVYKPLDLNQPDLLATDGLPPSETNPQFHQQMTYAVIMNTIKNFERALGRKVMWSPVQKIIKNKPVYEYVDKLLVYPHAIRDQNAYYSPERKALLFGYFNATPVNAGLFLPGGIVYSCLSHDIIAHETTHALLDGMYSRFMDSTHPDVPAFHEGFSDIVAMLQHFTYPDIVRNQIRKVKGALDTENLLAKLAVEFGQSTGEYSALRDSIGTTTDGKWERREANLQDYDKNFECHDRGALLVAAVFDAFLAIYNNRTADLRRIAGISDKVTSNDIHPDLVNRLADEASKTASHVLNICVRALDYCPPVDLNYGDYLRALITADAELVADDKNNYRIAFINAFRKRGIFPEDVPNLSVETLCYNKLDNEDTKKWFSAETFQFLRAFKEKLSYVSDRKKIHEITAAFIRGEKFRDTQHPKLSENVSEELGGFHSFIFNKAWTTKDALQFENLTGLVFSDQYKGLGIRTSNTYKKGPSIEIHSLRIHNRIGPDGRLLNQIIMTLAQRSQVEIRTDPKTGDITFHPGKKNRNNEHFTFLGGCTLIFDLNDLSLRHAISKPIFDPCKLNAGVRRKLSLYKKRLEMQYRCMSGDLVDKMGFTSHQGRSTEPLACIHKSKKTIL